MKNGKCELSGVKKMTVGYNESNFVVSANIVDDFLLCHLTGRNESFSRISTNLKERIDISFSKILSNILSNRATAAPP